MTDSHSLTEQFHLAEQSRSYLFTTGKMQQQFWTIFFLDIVLEALVNVSVKSIPESELSATAAKMLKR